MITQVDILRSYRKFIKGKAKKPDVVEFKLKAEESLVDLYSDISNSRYRHGDYQKFFLNDGKKREINKATVRDRIVHQLVYDYLTAIYDQSFYFHSYAARKKKGPHQAIAALRQMFRVVSQGRRKQVFVVKLDIRKFFANVDKRKLFELIGRRVNDRQILGLIEEIIFSFLPASDIGLPLGNLTSQIFANIYLNELDYFLKHRLRVGHYIRYMDDLILLAGSPKELLECERRIEYFLADKLKLGFRQDYYRRKFNRGVDFLGYVVFPHHLILRPKTKQRLLKRVSSRNLSSYLGLLSHCRSYNLRQKIAVLTAERQELI